MLNGAVGYQLLDDGTAVSVGLLFISSALIFIGTGYIALDTGFSWTNEWVSTLNSPNQAYALYTLYQLVPLVFLVIFFLLEAFLVLRVLGERKPMRTSIITFRLSQLLTTKYSISPRCSTPLRYRPNIPIRRKRPHLHGNKWQDQRWPVRKSLHTNGCGNGMGILVVHHRG
jgi:hypothetical protein